MGRQSDTRMVSPSVLLRLELLLQGWLGEVAAGPWSRLLPMAEIQLNVGNVALPFPGCCCCDLASMPSAPAQMEGVYDCKIVEFPSVPLWFV